MNYDTWMKSKAIVSHQLRHAESTGNQTQSRMTKNPIIDTNFAKCRTRRFPRGDEACLPRGHRRVDEVRRPLSNFDRPASCCEKSIADNGRQWDFLKSHVIRTWVVVKIVFVVTLGWKPIRPTGIFFHLQRVKIDHLHFVVGRELGPRRDDKFIELEIFG